MEARDAAESLVRILGVGDNFAVDGVLAFVDLVRVSTRWRSMNVSEYRNEQ